MIDLALHEELFVRQHVEHIEAMIGFEMENQYVVMTPEGYEALYAYEESGAVSRQFMGSHRPLDIHVVDNLGDLVLTANRPFFWFRSELHVLDSQGRPFGSLYRQFGFLKRKFALVDAHDRQVAQITSGMFRPNTFIVEDSGGAELGRITKEWGGIMREAFSDADTFRVSFSRRAPDNDFRLLVLASAFAIDLDFFEGRGRNVG